MSAVGDPMASPALQTDSTPERCNRPHSEVRRRSQLVGVRMTPEERERFQALADRRGIPLPELIRLACEAALLDEAIQQAVEAGWR